jgi:hypothetical protein
MELEIVILIEISQIQKAKPHVLSHMWNIHLIQIQQYYEKLLILEGGYIQEGQGKRRKLRR